MPSTFLTPEQRSLILHGLLDLLTTHKQRKQNKSLLGERTEEIKDLIMLIDRYEGELIIPAIADSIINLESL